MRPIAHPVGLIAALALSGCATGQAIPPTTMRAASDVGLAAQAAQDEVLRDTLPGDAAAPDTMRWLFGSGEAAGASIQAWRMLADFAVAAKVARPARSVALGLPGARGGTDDVACTLADGQRKPDAVALDVDETVLLNRGFEYWQATHRGGYDAGVWDDWARTGAPYGAPVPGAVTGLRRIRQAGITVIFNTNRDAATAVGTETALNALELGPARHGETLFMKGDDAMGSGKDGRRAMIAARWCVLALAGDNLGDFADVFNGAGQGVRERRERAARGPLAQIWGAGWFVLPNPVYGPGIAGSVDDIFPPDARWTPGTAGGE